MRIVRGYTVWCEGVSIRNKLRGCDSSETVDGINQAQCIRLLKSQGWKVRKNKLYCPDHSKQELLEANAK